MKKQLKKQKVCSRGHKFEGSGPCPTCWPSGARRYCRKKKKFKKYENNKQS